MQANGLNICFVFQISVHLEAEPPGVMGDIIVTPDQIQHMLNQHKHREKRNIMATFPATEWPTTIPYKIDTDGYDGKLVASVAITLMKY